MLSLYFPVLFPLAASFLWSLSTHGLDDQNSRVTQRVLLPANGDEICTAACWFLLIWKARVLILVGTMVSTAARAIRAAGVMTSKEFKHGSRT